MKAHKDAPIHMFDAWMSELEHLLQQHEKKHGKYSIPYSIPLSKCTGLDCWRESFEDGMSPQEALDEDMTHWHD